MQLYIRVGFSLPSQAFLVCLGDSTDMCYHPRITPRPAYTHTEREKERERQRERERESKQGGGGGSNYALAFSS